MECLHTLFSQQASATPETLAVVDDAGTITFEQLDRKAERLAAVLRRYGVGPDDTVGLFLPKSTDYVVACLAAMKAGGAFLPLFLDYPELLLSKVLEQTQSKVVITDTTLRTRLPAHNRIQTLLMDRESDWPEGLPGPTAVTLDNLMFVVYTSGTTGEPKGIQLPHRAAVHSYFERYKISSYQPGDRVACNIFFVWEVFRSLIKGATVYVVSDDIIYDPRQLSEYLSKHRISEILFTPSLMETVLNHLPPGAWRDRLGTLRTVWLNGEVVTEELRAKALSALTPHVRLYNTYSISECHDVASLDLRKAGVSPTGFCRVGYPIEGITVRLMESPDTPAPAGGPGELFVGGPGLARGYLGKPHLTAERFVTFQGERLYRTGDLAVQYPDGLLEIRGRCDAMVKIRGYSVHLGAVQSALEKIPGVQSAAVVAIGKEGRDKRLVAYVVGDLPVDPQTAACPELREKLRDYLAEFMLPNLFVRVDALPLNPTTGKLDARRLPPLPERTAQDTDDLCLSDPSSYQDKEALMATLWERLLGLDPGVVHPGSNFFDLGGHSLMAVRLTHLIERIMGCTVSVKQLYDTPTVKQLTTFLHTGEQAATSPDKGPRPEDWTLPDDLAPPSDTVYLPLNQARATLVTGGTGFLGAFLIDSILRSTEGPVYVLVRPGNRSGQQRLEENLRSYGLEVSPRVRAVAGDLSLPGLGLSPDDRALLVEQVQVVFHAGAAVNYVHSYAVLKPHTVDGTREILRLCCQGAGKTLHYVSTNGVFPGGGTYLEDADIDPYLQGLSNGYGLSKWTAEKLVWQAVERGLPATIYRPGNIGHHSRTGAANPNDFQTLIVRGCGQSGFAPEVPNWAFELTPVDFLVEIMTRFAADPFHRGAVYNIVGSPTISATTFFEYLTDRGLVNEICPLDDWKGHIRRAAGDSEEAKLQVLVESLPDVQGYLTDTSRYDSAKLESALTRHDLARPRTGPDYLAMLLEPGRVGAPGEKQSLS